MHVKILLFYDPRFCDKFGFEITFLAKIFTFLADFVILVAFLDRSRKFTSQKKVKRLGPSRHSLKEHEKT
jgi:hypothetical protein